MNNKNDAPEHILKVQRASITEHIPYLTRKLQNIILFVKFS